MDNQKQDFKSLSEKARVMPPSRAWDKLEEKLDLDVMHAKRKRSKLLSYVMNTAAMFIILLACIFIYQETQQDPTVSKGNIAEWEELESDSDNHYDIKLIHSLNSAYKS